MGRTCEAVPFIDNKPPYYCDNCKNTLDAEKNTSNKWTWCHKMNPEVLAKAKKMAEQDMLQLLVNAWSFTPLRAAPLFVARQDGVKLQAIKKAPFRRFFYSTPPHGLGPRTQWLTVWGIPFLRYLTLHVSAYSIRTYIHKPMLILPQKWSTGQLFCWPFCWPFAWKWVCGRRGWAGNYGLTIWTIIHKL